jgi:hypothetical protein
VGGQATNVLGESFSILCSYYDSSKASFVGAASAVIVSLVFACFV